MLPSIRTSIKDAEALVQDTDSLVFMSRIVESIVALAHSKARLKIFEKVRIWQLVVDILTNRAWTVSAVVTHASSSGAPSWHLTREHWQENESKE